MSSRLIWARAPLTSLGLTIGLFGLTVCGSEEQGPPPGPVTAGVYDTTADFSSFQTFDVVEPTIESDQVTPRSLLPANRIALIKSLIRTMESLGYVRDRDTPDLRITAFVRLQDVEVLIQTGWWDYYWGSYWRYGYDWYDRDLITLPAGTLVIDAVDVGDQADEGDDVLVFRGTATAVLPNVPTNVSGQIPAVVSAIYEYWPQEQ